MSILYEDGTILYEGVENGVKAIITIGKEHRDYNIGNAIRIGDVSYDIVAITIKATDTNDSNWNIYIPKSIDTISIEPTVNCNLRFCSLEGNKHFFVDERGSLYNADKTELIRYCPCNDSSESMNVKLPQTIRSIRNGAFTKCWVGTLELPSAITIVNLNQLNAQRIKTLRCNGKITKIEGNAKEGHPILSMQVNNQFSEITWSDSALYPAIIKDVIAKVPQFDESQVLKGIVKLHGIPKVSDAIKRMIDYETIAVAIDPHIENKIICSFNQSDGWHIDIGAKWTIVLKEEFIEAFDGKHKGSSIRFIGEDSIPDSKPYMLYEDVETVLTLFRASFT